MQVRHLSVSIERSPAEVYRFAADPTNLPRWARGLAEGPAQLDGDSLVVSSPMGTVRVRFVAPNALGVLDHDVTLPSGEVVHNPMRVIANGGGSEVVFSLFRRSRVTDVELDADAAAVMRDLQSLKSLLETAPL